MKITFFPGKGGTGKSTVSCVQALKDSLTGETVLISLDPAHNLADILDVKLRDKVKKIAPRLRAAEIDEKKLIKKYLRDMSLQMKKNYSYQSAFNLLGYFDLFQYSPAVDEFALIMAFEDIVKKNPGVYSIIFDMPPTALSLKFFQLPHVTLKWLHHLIKLRLEILKKKEIITSIKLGKREMPVDRVLNKLKDLRDRYTLIKKIFSDREMVSVIPVLNGDSLSIRETEYLISELELIEIIPEHLILNKSLPSDYETVEKHFALDIKRIPASEKILRGIENLSGFAEFL